MYKTAYGRSMMQMWSILRTAQCSVKCCAHYSPLPRLLRPSAIPQESLSPSSCRLPFAKDILYLLCTPARVGTRRLEESPPTVQRAVWNAFTSRLMPMLLAPWCAPSVAPGVSSTSTGNPPKSSSWSATNVPPLPAPAELSFRPFLTCSATCTKSYRVGYVSCPSTAEGEGYVHEGTDRRTGSV